MTEKNLLDNVEAEVEETLEEQNDTESGKTVETTEEIEKVKPEDLDESFWDAEKGEIKVDDVLSALGKEKEKALGLRRKLSEKGIHKAPKKSSDYKLEQSEGSEPIIKDDSDVMASVKKSAHESGLSNVQFNSFLSKLLPALKEKGLIVDPEVKLTEEEQNAQHAEFTKTEIEKLGEKGPQAVQALKNWSAGMVNRGILSPDDQKVFEDMAYDAKSIRVLNKIRSLTGEPSIPVKTVIPNGLPSQDEIEAIMRTDKYKNGDPATRKKVSGFFAAVYPGSKTTS